METLLDLSLLNDWKNYCPSTARYTEAPKDELQNADIKGLLNSLEELEGNSTLAGQFIWQDAPNPAVGYGSIVEGSHVYKHRKEEVPTCNPSWSRVVKAGVKRALGSLTTKDVPIICNQADMVVVATDSTQLLDLRQVSEHHFATALVIVPSYYTSSSATLEARHGPLAYAHKLSKTGPFATLFAVMYAGMDSAMLKTAGGPICYLTYHILSDSSSPPTLRNLTGPHDEISKAFAAWHLITKTGTQEQREALPKHILCQLKGEYGEKQLSAANIDHPTDKLVLGNLAPPARHYGFDILFTQVSVHLQASLQLKDGSDDSDGAEYYDYTPDNFTLRDNWDGEVETEWKFTSLDGVPIEGDEQMEDRLYEDIERQSIYNRRIDFKDETGKGLEVDWDGDREYSYLSVLYEKRASFILVVPEKKESLDPRDSSRSGAENGASSTMGDLGKTPHGILETTRDSAGVGHKRKRT